MAGYERIDTLVLKPKFSTQVPFPGCLVFHKVQVSGEYLPPLCIRYIYIDALLIALLNHAYALNINSLSLPSPSFADDISLLAIQPTFLRVLMQMCYCYSLK